MSAPWEEQVLDILLMCHPVEIENHIVKPAVKQIIDDYEKSIQYYTEDETEQIKLTEELIVFWRDILNKIEED